MQYLGRFTDEPTENELTPRPEADPDTLYDLRAEDQADRHDWPGNTDTHLMRLAGGSYEDDYEMAIRCGAPMEVK